MSTIEERAARLRERTQEDYPPAWDFKEIPNVTGVVESIREATGPLGKRIVVQVREVEGPPDARKRYAIWLSQRALYSRFAELAIGVGELISATYLGVSDHAEVGQSPAHRFRVEVDREGQPFQWPGGSSTSAAPTGDELTPEEQRVAHEAAMETVAGDVGAEDRAPTPTDDDIPF